MPLSQISNDYLKYTIGLTGSSGFTNNTSSIILIPQLTNINHINKLDKKDFLIKNLDTVSNTFITFISDSQGEKIIEKIKLAPGESWTSENNIIISTMNSSFMLKLSSSISTYQFVWNINYNNINKGI